MKNILVGLFSICISIAAFGDTSNSHDIEIANLNGGIWIISNLNGKCSINQQSSFLHANGNVAYKGDLANLSEFGITVSPSSNSGESSYRAWGKIDQEVVLDIQFSGPSSLEKQLAAAFSNPYADITYVKLTEASDCLSPSVLPVKNLQVIKNIFGN